jgi:hypothetical protein
MAWLINFRLHSANSSSPPANLQAHYGQKDPAAVAKVKEVYAQLGLAAKFEAYEAKSFQRHTKQG